MTPSETSTDSSVPEKFYKIRSETADIGLALVLISASIWYIWTASNFPTRGSSWVQASTFPTGIGYLTIISCLALILFALIRIIRNQPLKVITIGHPWRVVIGMICTLIYPSILPALGFYVTSALFTGVFGYVAGIRKIIPLLAVTLGFLAFTKIVFEQILGTPLPTGNWL